VTVYLVGAGPGDPGLLTLRAAEVLARADVVVYDRLSVSSLLDLAPGTAERISVGKARGTATMPQDEINALLVERGRAGQAVVRLKGGDPFVFARGGEEAAALLEAGVSFEVVPGVTSALAAPAFAGVPVTHRGMATSFTVVTGHEDPWAAKDTDWDAVARVGGTIVVLMGVATRAAIAARLIEGGLAPDTPVTAVRWGTRPEQETIRTTLAGLGTDALEAPATIVIGAVAGLDLQWFEARPLFGRRIVVTRAREQSSDLVARLREVGAYTVELPVIRVTDPADGGMALRAAAARVHEYAWVVLTSANGAERLCRELRDARAFGAACVAAIGPGTAAVLRKWGVAADLVPTRYVAEALLDVFPTGAGSVLLARAAVARDVLPDGLRNKGWTVDVVEAYRTARAPVSDELRELARTADAVTFTSSSTVTNYLEAVGSDAVPRIVACIGPVTAATARDHGLVVDVEAAEHTVDGLVDALIAHLSREGRSATRSR
jgi:uroporphyrinogen III methyltransferase/synthase